MSPVNCRTVLFVGQPTSRAYSICCPVRNAWRTVASSLNASGSQVDIPVVFVSPVTVLVACSAAPMGCLMCTRPSPYTYVWSAGHPSLAAYLCAYAREHTNTHTCTYVCVCGVYACGVYACGVVRLCVRGASYDKFCVSGHILLL